MDKVPDVLTGGAGGRAVASGWRSEEAVRGRHIPTWPGGWDTRSAWMPCTGRGVPLRGVPHPAWAAPTVR